jgi:hypothetical protein
MRQLQRIAVLALLVSCSDETPPDAASTADVRGKPIASAPSSKPKLPPEVVTLTGANGVNLAADAPPADPPKEKDGYREVKFELLTSYDYEWSQTTGIVAPGAAGGAQIPPEVRALDRQKVFIVGYMQPIDFDNEGVRTFLLTNYPGGCCFGMVPRLNEWVEVSLGGDERVEYSYFDAIEIHGKLEVGEAKSGEVVTSLYRMTPDKVEIADAR